MTMLYPCPCYIELCYLVIRDCSIITCFSIFERGSEKRVLKAFQQLLHNRHLKNA